MKQFIRFECQGGGVFLVRPGAVTAIRSDHDKPGLPSCRIHFAAEGQSCSVRVVGTAGGVGAAIEAAEDEIDAAKATRSLGRWLRGMERDPIDDACRQVPPAPAAEPLVAGYDEHLGPVDSDGAPARRPTLDDARRLNAELQERAAKTGSFADKLAAESFASHLREREAQEGAPDA